MPLYHFPKLLLFLAYYLINNRVDDRVLCRFHHDSYLLAIVSASVVSSFGQAIYND